MTINLKLAAVTVGEPDTDPMHRDWVGWEPGLSDQETYEQNRGVWRLGARAKHERYATFSCDGRVRVVVAIDGIEKIPSLDDRPAKDALVGRVLGRGDAAYEALMDQPVDNFRNPVTYGPDPSGEPRRCACGCGSAVPKTRVFLPGHDQRAIHDRITHEWGSTLEFIRWFDATYGSPRDALSP
jgi:hypothetical protein